MYPNSIFLTLTYSDAKLGEKTLCYTDFQKFVKRLRDWIFQDYLIKLFPTVETTRKRKKLWNSLPADSKKNHISKFRIDVFPCGEYGGEKKRKHWHCIIFNWKPSDTEFYRTSETGDKLYKSNTIEKLWGFNDSTKKPNEFGNVTYQSANYVARYSLKKVKDHNDDPEYAPVAVGKSKKIGFDFFMKYHRDMFNHGYLVYERGPGVYKRCSIPRRYQKWCEKYFPELYAHYLEIKKDVTLMASIETEEREEFEREIFLQRRELDMPRAFTQNEVSEIIFDSMSKLKTLDL